jgi:hypothetical protein
MSKVRNDETKHLDDCLKKGREHLQALKGNTITSKPINT